MATRQSQGVVPKRTKTDKQFADEQAAADQHTPRVWGSSQAVGSVLSVGASAHTVRELEPVLAASASATAPPPPFLSLSQKTLISACAFSVRLGI